MDPAGGRAFWQDLYSSAYLAGMFFNPGYNIDPPSPNHFFNNYHCLLFNSNDNQPYRSYYRMGQDGNHQV
jgi:hypothetical protein